MRFKNDDRKVYPRLNFIFENDVEKAYIEIN